MPGLAVDFAGAVVSRRDEAPALSSVGGRQRIDDLSVCVHAVPGSQLCEDNTSVGRSKGLQGSVRSRLSEQRVLRADF